MLQGTGSHVGKSLLVAGLCRAARRRGLTVRPFKPQNMSNNAAVTMDGGEIGRAQALQASAAGCEPHTDMNPVLLKPDGPSSAQVVVHGQVRTRCGARDYHELKPTLLADVMASFQRLSDQADLVLVEGAGSPAEVNLRQGDIANMGFAETAGVPVALVGDIERGGVVASLIGTHSLLKEHEKKLLKGYIVNKFRGDPSLFDAAHPMIREQTGMTSFGVVPWCDAAQMLPAEDSLGLRPSAERDGKALRIGVLRTPRLANFDDFDPLFAEPQVAVIIIEAGQAIPGDLDLVILAGSKATIADLAFVREQGWNIDLVAHHRRGGRILGICGGLQMLGTTIDDPAGIEGDPGSVPGLGLLQVTTILVPRKTLDRVEGHVLPWRASARGYEMHVGVTAGPDTARPMIQFSDRNDGALSADGRVMGCYLHGLFADAGARTAFLTSLGATGAGEDHDRIVHRALDALADHLETHLNRDQLLEIAAAR
ncbi:MAG: cobyric acid synthase [Geminicoccaceae bacterium]